MKNPDRSRMLNKLARSWWMILAGLVLLYASIASPTIVFDTALVLRRTSHNASIVFSVMGGLALGLLIAVVLAARGSQRAALACKWWATCYSLVVLSLLFFLFEVREPFPMIVMLAFSVAWYFGASRAVGQSATRPLDEHAHPVR